MDGIGTQAGMVGTRGGVVALVLEIDTTKAGTASDSFQLSTTSTALDDYKIDWGDGTTDDVVNAQAPLKTYDTSGLYTVIITGVLTQISFNNGGDKLKILSVSNTGVLIGSSLSGSFYGCSNNLVFAGQIADGVTSFFLAWRDNNLTSWTVALPTSLTDCSNAWRDNSLTSWTVDLPAGLTNCSYAWRDNNLTSWTVELPDSITNCSHAWNSNSLTSWTVDLPTSLTTCSYAWYGNDLTAWTVDLPTSLTSCAGAWQGNDLTAWTVDLPTSLTNCSYAWFANDLTAWAAGLFDSWSATPATNCFLESWGNNTGLTPTAVENILVSIAASGVEGPATGNEITIDYDGAGLTAATTTAIATLKGYVSPWSIKINGVTQ